VQSRARRSIYDSGRTPAYDGAAMMWSDHMESLRAASGTAEFERLRADIDNFIARDKSPFVIAAERVVLR
jgi:hypothetical protein